MSYQNWAGNYTYGATELIYPENMEHLQQLVKEHPKIKVLGSGHTFNAITDTDHVFISLRKWNRILKLNKEKETVTVEGGATYGELCAQLSETGYALHNLASLPHITVAGAVATSTHGSGSHNVSLSAAVESIELIDASGEVHTFNRGDEEFAGVAVHLGALGIITKLTLKVVPAYTIKQFVYENLPVAQLKDHAEDIFASAYSVSLFTDWQQPRFHQVWTKSMESDGASYEGRTDFYGATPAKVPLHPLPDMHAENCTEQLGKPGMWHERLAHFKMEFTPSAGKELQSEYLMSFEHVYEASLAVHELREHLAPVLFVSEVRTIAADDLWMSPFYNQPSVAFHFTWRDDWQAVERVLPFIEKALAPFHARPHWGKLFTVPAEQLQQQFDKLPKFRELIEKYDPQGKFSNAFLDKYIRNRTQ
ncbi:FAD-binding protein [Paenibacillus bovis]|uniref:FAD-binding protein n=1 Tax=Paenibacillus bovis TaxID=1616788 RepID=A0A172ZIS3_9BACL|nr:FAD-binding protein [Paenibacillus bovis]ANF97030.1 FAD-binding protein [Paenibacillus bovis]